MPSDNITSLREAAEAGPGRGAADMMALCRHSIRAAMASNQAAICGVQETTSTLLAFLQSRAKDGLAASQQLAACRSPDALVEVQLEYFKAMLQAYTDEFGRLHGLAGKTLADILVPAQASVVAVPRTKINGGVLAA